MEYDGSTVQLFMSCNVVFSFFGVIFLLPVIVRSVCSKVDAAINKEQNHANLAAFVVTGLVFSTFVLVLDIIALVLVAEGKHEFSHHSNVSSLTFVIITAVFDAIAVLITYIILIYLGLSKSIQNEKLDRTGEQSTSKLLSTDSNLVHLFQFFCSMLLQFFCSMVLQFFCSNSRFFS